MKRPIVTDFTETIYRADAYKYTQEQEKYIDYLEAQAKQLILHSVSQQRERLLAYEEFTSYKVLGKKTPRISKQMVEDYLANNCG